MAIRDGLVHCWRFNTGSGYTVYDTGSDPDDLTLHNDITWFTDGTWGNGVRYANPGDSDSITRVNISPLSGPATFMSFFRQPTAGGQWAGASFGPPGTGYGNSCFMGAISATSLTVQYWSYGASHYIEDSTLLPHIYMGAIPASTAYMSTYVDDNSAEDTTGTVNFPWSDATRVAIGACDWDTQTGGREFYLVCIWNRTLSSDEIQTVMGNPYIVLETAILGSTVWGHTTSATEGNKQTFTDNWTGTGMILGSGDTEKMLFSTGNYMESEIVNTGANSITFTRNKYGGSGSPVMKYRSASSIADCQSGSWSSYSGSFASLGYVQIRLEKS